MVQEHAIRSSFHVYRRNCGSLTKPAKRVGGDIPFFSERNGKLTRKITDISIVLLLSVNSHLMVRLRFLSFVAGKWEV